MKILVPGSVLLDVYTDSNQVMLGGASFNYAYHLWRFGVDVTFLSRIGTDDAGKRILNALKGIGFPIKNIQFDSEHSTKTVYISYDSNGEPIFDITENVSSEYLDYPEIDLNDIDMMYFGTTIQHGKISKDVVRKMIADFNGLKFCDINLRNNRYTLESVKYSINSAAILDRKLFY